MREQHARWPASQRRKQSTSRPSSPILHPQLIQQLKECPHALERHLQLPHCIKRQHQRWKVTSGVLPPGWHVPQLHTAPCPLRSALPPAPVSATQPTFCSIRFPWPVLGGRPKHVGSICAHGVPECQGEAQPAGARRSRQDAQLSRKARAQPGAVGMPAPQQLPRSLTLPSTILTRTTIQQG